MSTQNEELQKCLAMQIDELEMLSSIYCNAGELKIDDPAAIADIHEFLANKTTQVSSQLDYTICLRLNDNSSVDIHIVLPHFYPKLECASVTIRSGAFNVNKEHFIRSQVSAFIKTIAIENEVQVYQIIQYLEDNWTNFDKHNNSINSESNDKLLAPENELVELERLWIYSHHIKSKSKRQTIVRTARELELSGFSKPGKPGVICVEGLKVNTQEFWKIIRSLNWQKITTRKSEIKMKPLDKIDNYRKFKGFREELFTDIDSENNSAGEVVKMDMSIFMKYLEMHNCSYIKKDLFGFD